MSLSLLRNELLVSLLNLHLLKARRFSLLISLFFIPASVTNSFAQSLPSQQQVQGTLNQAAQSANETASQAANTVAQSLPSENQVRGAANEGINQASNAAAQVASVLPSVQDVRNTTANAIRAAADLLPTGEQVEQTAESVTRQTRNAAESVSQQARAATQPVVQEARSVAREVTQPERVLAAPPTLPTRESSMETPGTVKILDRQVIGGPSPSTGENVYPRPVDQESVSSRSAPVSESLYAKPPTTGALRIVLYLSST
jgi:ABC-type transporter Mla subunit MlaD